MRASRRYPFATLLFLCILTALATMAVKDGVASPVMVETYDHWLFLPFLDKPASSIDGYVTEDGSPAAQVQLTLVYFDGEQWQLPAETITDDQGKYVFPGLEPLSAGQTYHVFYTASKADRIGAWWTPRITELPIGATFQNETFDIAWVNPDMKPVWGSVVTLPTTFTWNRRTASHSESYQFAMQTGGGDEVVQSLASTDWAYYESELLGYADSYRLTELPTGFEYGADYIWWIVVHSPPERDAGIGVSSWHPIVFEAPG